MEELLEILKELHEDVDYETCNNLVDGKILDSFDIVTLIGEISTTFDIQIKAKEIVPENFNSMQAMYKMIERLQDE